MLRHPYVTSESHSALTLERDAVVGGHGVPVGGADIAAMGVGGLLMEIVSRPQPRELEPMAMTEPPRIAALLLAAGVLLLFNKDFERVHQS